MNADNPIPSTSTLRCPTCGARQSRSLECRRCKCDLSLVVTALRQADHLTRQCLQMLREDRVLEAEVLARRLAELLPGPDSARYVGVCHLLLGRFQSAVDLAVASPPNQT